MEEGIHSIVCIKQVTDPDASPSVFEVDSEKKKVTAAGAPPVLSPFDENALEAALRIKDNYGGKITVLSMGKKLAQRVLIKSLAAGADEMVLLQDDAFEDLDSFGTACTLAAAIRKIGEFDIIFCGILAADTNEGQVGLATAEILGIPAVTLVQKIEPGNGKLKVEQVLPEGYDVLDVPMPALLTVGSELYELRYPSIIALKEAKKKPVTIWNAQDVGVDVTQIKRKKIVTLYPRVSATTCEVIGGENMKAVGINLALKLRDAGII